MGNEAQDQYLPKKVQGYHHQHTHIPNQNHILNKPLFLVIFTNLITIYIFTGPLSFLYHPFKSPSELNSLLQELNSTKAQLASSHSLLSELHQRLSSTNLLVQALLIDLTRLQEEDSDNLKKKQGNYYVEPTLLHEREKGRWIFDDGGLDFGIDQVLATREPGTIRIGLDIGDGAGTFAAMMREKNVTIITSLMMNLDGSFNNFIASRGLIAMNLSISQRLPFFENTLDIVHSMDVISNYWLPETMLEFVLYDIYRVLRPGGLFWLDHFFCFGSQLDRTYAPMFERIGFNRLRWHVGMKLDRGVPKNEWCISALLEKPVI